MAAKALLRIFNPGEGGPGIWRRVGGELHDVTVTYVSGIDGAWFEITYPASGLFTISSDAIVTARWTSAVECAVEFDIASVRVRIVSNTGTDVAANFTIVFYLSVR